jgi:hypothetical protein
MSPVSGNRTRRWRAVRGQVRPNLIALAALFFALTGGVAFATHPGGQNTISSADIINKEVGNADLAPNSVGSGKITDGEVKNPDYNVGSVKSNSIGNGQVKDVDLANGAVSEQKLADAAVTIPKLAFGPWTLDGNAGTDAATDFLGTTDEVPLNLRVNDARALRLEPASDGTNQSPNVIGGIADNAVTDGVHSATISGGGRRLAADPATANRVTDDFGAVGGGAHNQAGDEAGTTSDAPYATVGGGLRNDASGAGAFVGGGALNDATDAVATVGGGQANDASDQGATVGGGVGNEATMLGATVGGGFNNEAIGTKATVAGGEFNHASEEEAAIGGGAGNTASGSRATVGGGGSNDATGLQATVGGGAGNTASSSAATVGGGFGNDASGGGAGDATVGGGRANGASGSGATVGGGRSNTASGQEATVGGGLNNVASGLWGTVPGGSSNTASGRYSFAAGRRAKANHDGAFVWADSQAADMASSEANQFIARAGGGFFLQDDSTLDDQGGFINTSTEAYLSTTGVWQSTSDRRLKEDFAAIEPREVLREVAELPVTSWRYKADRPGVRHVGPTAQDFYRAFGLGDSTRHIGPLDGNGVALAAIQGLASELRIERRLRLKQERRFEARLAALERDGR